MNRAHRDDTETLDDTPGPALRLTPVVGWKVLPYHLRAPCDGAFPLVVDSLFPVLWMLAVALALLHLFSLSGWVGAGVLVASGLFELLVLSRAVAVAQWRNWRPKFGLRGATQRLAGTCLVVLAIGWVQFLIARPIAGLSRVLFPRQGVAIDKAALADSPLPGRVQFIGEAVEIEPILALRNLPFEPFTVQIPRSDLMGSRWAMHIVLGIAVTGFLLWWFPDALWQLTGIVLEPPTLIVTLWGIGGLIGEWLYVLLSRFSIPTYLRVVPGRLDVIQYASLSKRGPTCQRINLHQATMEIRLHEVKIMIRTREWPGGLLKINLRHTAERHRLARAIVLGAISSAPPWTIEEGELMG